MYGYLRLFFFNDTATTEIYTLSLHDALPILPMWISWIPTIILILVMVGFWVMFMQQSQGGGGGNRGVMNFGKSRAKLAAPDSQKVTFKDVAGADEEKGELEEIVDFLKEPKKYLDMGARIPKGKIGRAHV